MKSDTLCPKCRRTIPLDDINVSTDVALCRRCEERWSFGDLVRDQDLQPIDALAAPAGTWLVDSPLGFEIGVSTRSATAFFLVPFMCVWSGFSLSGIYGSQLMNGRFDWAMSLFGIPFILGTLFFGSTAMMSVCGKVVVKVAGDSGEVFTGVGPVGWTRRLDWSQVTSIRITQKWGSNASVSDQITLMAGAPINIAVGVSAPRLNYMFVTLRQKWRQTSHPSV
jgi:hypothetical protein